MALQLIDTPPRWSAAFEKVQYEFNFVLKLDGAPVHHTTDNVLSLNGNLAINFFNEYQVGERYFLARRNDNVLFSATPVTITDIIVTGSGDFALTDLPYNTALGTGVSLYTLDTIARLQPAFFLYANGRYYTTIKPVYGPNNALFIKLESYLQSLFEYAVTYPPGEGILSNLFQSYYLEYAEQSVTQRDQERYVGFSTLPYLNPACADAEPRYEFDLATLRCEQAAPRTSANRVAKKKDTNPNSPTYNTHQNGGRFFFYDTDVTACPIQNTAPDWQFDLTTLRCEQNAPRSSSNRVARQKDNNPYSSSYNQFKDNGAFFYYDNNAAACPVDEPVSYATLYLTFLSITTDDFVNVNGTSYTYDTVLTVTNGSQARVYVTANYRAGVHVSEGSNTLYSSDTLTYVNHSFNLEGGKVYQIVVNAKDAPGGPSDDLE